MYENSKVVIKTIGDFAKQTKTALSDGKFTGKDLFGYLDEAMEVPAFINAVKPAIKEWNGISDDGANELEAYAVEAIGLETAKAKLFCSGVFHALKAAEEIAEALAA